jgi:hypothetical protein
VVRLQVFGRRADEEPLAIAPNVVRAQVRRNGGDVAQRRAGQF